MVEEDMGTDAGEQVGEAKIVEEHEGTGEVEIGKMEGDMAKTETGEDIGKVGGEDVRKAETESTGEDTGIDKTEKMEEDAVKMEIEKVDEGMENMRTEKVDEDLGKEETEKTSEDMEKEEDNKTVDDMGRPDIESTEEDIKKAEIEKEDENVVKPTEEDTKEDGKTVIDHVMKEPDENKLEEQNDSEDSDKDEEAFNGENEAEAQVSVGRKRPRKRSNREQAKEDVAKSLEEDHKEDGGTATDHDLKESEGNKLEEHHDSDGSDKDGEKTDEEKEAEAKLSMGRKRPRKQSNKGQAKEEAKEPISPAVHIDRPVRERKSVERLVASIEKEPAREFLIPKGRGTALKDIPNVAHKLSRKKNEDTVKMLHVILFGRRGKATHVKSNVSQFSGFAWHENEEKQRSKMKEKLDKLVKEKLLEFCDVFDIPVLKATVKKEDVVTKLLDFLAAPHPKGDAVVAEKEKVGSVKKRSRIVKESGPNSGDASAKNSSKKQRKNEGSPTLVGEEFDSDSEDGFDRSEPVHVFEEEEDGLESVPDRSDDEVGGHSESKGKGSDARDEAEVDIKKQNMSVQRSTKVKSPTRNKSKKMTTGKEETRLSSPKKRHISKHPKDESRKEDDAERENSILNGSEDEAGEHSESLKGKGRGNGESEEETTNQNQSSKRSSSKKATPVTGKSKKVATTGKEAPVRSPKISPSTIKSKVNDNGDRAAVVFSRKKKNQETSTKKPTVPLKSCSKENDSKRQSGEKSVLEKNVTMKDSCAPSEQELRKVICEILSEVDLNKATFIDILKQLGQHFQMDLEPRKSLIKIMVKEELIKLNDDDDDEDEDDEDDEESDNEKEKPRSAVREVRKTKPPPINSAASVDEENRCRRSDGKKWRCSKEVVKGQKYCEHHLNRGKIKKR